MTDGDDAPRSKVARLLDEYGLEGVGPELEARWTATGDAHWSLRDLATHLNEALVRERLQAAGENPSRAEVETVTSALAGDESAAERTQVRRRLERSGVDADSLERDLVTYQAVRSYLRDYRGASYDPESRDPVAAVTDAVEKLRGRLVSVTESKLRTLRSTSRLSIGEFRVMVDVQVLCTDCHGQYGVRELLTEGGCDCDAE
ncbi:MAG: rod-determining factor RdfA [Halobacterium sp.]